MNIHTSNQLTTAINSPNRSPLRRGLVLIALVFASLALSPTARAQSAIAGLAGSWQATLLWSGSGCGPAAGLVNFTLDSTGTTNSAVLVFHSGPGEGCGDSTLTGQTFTIKSLNADGSGTANLSCGPDCGWEFNIQVSRSIIRGAKPDIFNLVDVDPENPGNFVEGSAIRQH